MMIALCIFLIYMLITLLLTFSLDDVQIDPHNKYFWWKFFGWPVYFPLMLIYCFIKYIHCEIIIKRLDNK